ncbi:MAG: hypothetical protein PWR22_1349 [Moorella sp. (in: firmicutes)]|jgi:hypothetical protein|nr:hypothetical protein [Moorella sp. (in: firmicutes)]
MLKPEKPLPNNRNLVGKTYLHGDGGIIEVVGVCSLFPATRVVVEKKSTGKRWSVAVERIMDLIA